MKIQFSERKEKYCFPKFPIAPFAKEAEPNRIRKWKNAPLARGREGYTNPEGLFLGRSLLFGNAPSAWEKERFPSKNATLVPDTAFQKSEEITVKVPPGIRDGEAISLPGMGEAVAGGTAGDLYVKFTVGKHPIFRRDNLNLVMDLDVKMSEALLGAEKGYYDFGRVDKIKSAGRHKLGRNFGGARQRRSAGTWFVRSQRQRRFDDKNCNPNSQKDFQKSQRFD